MAEDLSALDVGVLPNPWNDAVFSKYANKKKLKFGYYFDDGVTIASPPVERAVLMTAKALQAQGHEVVSIVPPNVVEAVQCFVALTTYDGSLPPLAYLHCLIVASTYLLSLPPLSFIQLQRRLAYE